jgi:hypothetical protein
VRVEKKGKFLMPHFRCQSVGTVKFSVGSAAKSTSAQPSTNTPIQCPECGTKPIAQFFWKYEHSEQARAPHTNGPRDVPRYGALSLLQKTLHYNKGG